MITTVIVAGGVGGHPAAAPATDLATALAGQAPRRVLALPAEDAVVRAALADTDLLVVASTVVDSRIDPGLDRLLRSLAVTRGLGGVVGFALTVGAWPQPASVVDNGLRGPLEAAGAFCPAPGLHVAGGDHAVDRLVSVYASYWAQPVPALLAAARAGVGAWAA